MIFEEDPYKILGLEKSASQEDISKAYRSLAAKYHPDKNPNDQKESAEKFKKISAAFEIIGDEKKRKQFDFYGNPQPFPSFSFRNRNSVDDLFSNIFSQFFGDQKSFGSKIRVKISLIEAYHGCTKQIKTEKHKFCRSCEGTGSPEWSSCQSCSGQGYIFSKNGPMNIQTSCSVCEGKGSLPKQSCKECYGKGYIVESTKDLDVKIPKGIEDTTQIRIPGEAPDGNDLFVVVNVEKDSKFIRDGRFLIGTIDVSYSILVLGGDLDFDVFGTQIKVKIPPRLQAGSRIKIKGQGMPLVQNPNIKGDLVLEVKLKIPTTINKDYENLLSRLLEIEKQ